MRKRGKYKPRPVVPNPVDYVINGRKPLVANQDNLLDLKVKNHNAMAALVRGEATKADMDMVISMHNVAEALYRMGFGAEYGNVIARSQDALTALLPRGVATGRWILRAEEMQAFNALTELHDAQLEIITVRELDLAVRMVHDIIRSGQAHPVPKGARA